MVARSPTETHRAATPLELFFDLVLVVAIAFASSSLHHALEGGHVDQVIVSYAMVFFAIWWPWINFTWFASAYDTDDVAYRILVLVQMAGALVVATGVPQLFEDLDRSVVLVGYVIMRLASVTLWLRAARSDPDRRASALRYAIGITLVQAAWIALYFAPESLVLPGFALLVAAELAVPVWAERRAPTTWHRGHIAERYGLFTIIVLGESILQIAMAIQAAATGNRFGPLFAFIVGALLIVFGMWWLYFELAGETVLTSLRRAFLWGYGHYFIWAAAAAVGAGIAVAVDQSTGHVPIEGRYARFAVAVPVAAYILCVWAINHVPTGPTGKRALLAPLAALLVLLTPLSDQGVLLIGLILVALVAAKLSYQIRDPEGLGSTGELGIGGDRSP